MRRAPFPVPLLPGYRLPAAQLNTTTRASGAFRKGPAAGDLEDAPDSLVVTFGANG